MLEEAANEAFSVYREMYYEGTGISSVYLWDLEDPNSSAALQGSGSFAGVVLLKKTASGTTNKSGEGSWDSIHVFEVNERSRTGNYKLTSTVSFHELTDLNISCTNRSRNIKECRLMLACTLRSCYT